MKARFRYFLSSLIVFLLCISCKKAAVPTPVSTSNTFNATVNGSVQQFNGSVSQVSTNQFVVSGTSTTNVKLQFSFYAPSSGYYALGTNHYAGEATITSASGEAWSTNVSDSGSVYVSIVNQSAQNIQGTFSFTADETKPTSNGSTISVTNGSFDLNW